MDSDAFVDPQLELFSKLPRPWAYNRLVDVTDCVGTCAYDSLSRFAKFWEALQFQMDRIVRASVVSRNGLTVARLPSIQVMFPKARDAVVHRPHGGRDLAVETAVGNPYADRQDANI